MLRHVKRGDPLRIPANDYNAMIDAARAHRNDQVVGRVFDGRIGEPDIVLVRNETGSDIGQFDVLAISGVVFDPSDPEALHQFKIQFVLSGSVPSTSRKGQFVIASEPIPAGKIGRAYASGVCPVLVNSDGNSKSADVADGQTGYLQGGSGAAQILWRDNGTGAQWAVVRFGGGSGSGEGFLAVVAECPETESGGWGKIGVHKLVNLVEDESEIIYLRWFHGSWVTEIDQLCYAAPLADDTYEFMCVDLVPWFRREEPEGEFNESESNTLAEVQDAPGLIECEEEA